jgi:hypothetical protein
MAEYDKDAGEQQRLPISLLPFAVQLQDVVSIDIVARRFPVDLPPDMSVNIRIGVISFDNSQQVERRLKFLSADACIQAYGLDVLRDLQYSPFDA